MKKQLGCIQVQVPPDIDDQQSTASDITANEGDNVTLTCVARGKPAPRIVWRREDGQKIAIAVTPPAQQQQSGRSSPNNKSNNSSGSGNSTLHPRERIKGNFNSIQFPVTKLTDFVETIEIRSGIVSRCGFEIVPRESSLNGRLHVHSLQRCSTGCFQTRPP